VVERELLGEKEVLEGSFHLVLRGEDADPSLDDAFNDLEAHFPEDLGLDLIGRRVIADEDFQLIQDFYDVIIFFLLGDETVEAEESLVAEGLTEELHYGGRHLLHLNVLEEDLLLLKHQDLNGLFQQF